MTFRNGVILVVIFLLIPALTIGKDTPVRERAYSEAVESPVTLTYEDQANILSKCLLKEKVKVDTRVVVKMLKAIDSNMPRFFPMGPFTRNDFIAIAWLENCFQQYGEDGTHGEKGLFQIMPDEFSGYNITKNFYDIDINTKMAFRVLDGKYKRWGEYKKSIIAYNGLVRNKNGKYSEKYWKAFEKRKIVVDLVLAGK